MNQTNYQSEFLAYLFGETEVSPLPNGHLYRNGLEARAIRTLGIRYPTVKALIGDDSFRAASLRYFRTEKKRSGDWFDAGRAFADWLAEDAPLAGVPYLADMARLEWTLALIERSDYGEVDARSFSLLEQAPLHCALVLNPQVRFFRAAYPLVSVWEAHRSEAPQGTPEFERARELLARALGENVLVSRDGWRGVAEVISDQSLAWVERLKTRKPVAELWDKETLMSAAFAVWLQGMVSRGVVVGATLPG